MSVDTLLSDLNHQVLSECFRVGPGGRVLWKAGAVNHFEMNGRAPRNFGSSRNAAGSNGIIRFNYASYREEDIAWRLQVGKIPQGGKAYRIDPDNRMCFPDNLKLICNSGVPAVVGMSWGVFL